MATNQFIIPRFSRRAVDRAGAVLAEHQSPPPEMDDALEVLSNWRAAHAYPLNTFQVTLRKKAPIIGGKALVVQRLKRTPSIIHKLRRFPDMKLSRMQDLGGCRAVMRSTAQAERLRDAYMDARFDHELCGIKDYIKKPAQSGYRGVHLAYKYRSRAKSKAAFNGLRIELQFRSKLQHVWATAVETVGTFLSQSLKSSDGDMQWLSFFRLMGSAFALLEKRPVVDGTPDNAAELRPLIRREAEALDVWNYLAAFRTALQIPNMRSTGHFYLLVLEPALSQLRYYAYQLSELATAEREYLAEERRLANSKSGNVVLVSAQSLHALRQAYPNYFLDTAAFITELNRFLK